MTTFKQFLKEHDDGTNVEVEWKVSSPRLDAGMLIPFVKRHCPKMMKNYVDNGVYLYRGFINDILKPGRDLAIVDTTNSRRKSRHSNNAYHVLLSMADNLKHVPDRGSSMICSTRRSTAGMYSNNVRLVIPFDDCVIGHAKGIDDMLYRGGININGMHVEYHHLNRGIAILCHALGVQHSKLEVTKDIIEQVDEKIKQMTPEWLFFHLADAFFDVSRMRHLMVKSPAPPIINTILVALDNDSSHFWPNREANYEWISEAMTRIDIKKELTAKGSSFYSWILDNYKSGLFTSLSSVMSPETTGIDAQTTADPLPRETEVWFSGHALVMTELKFKELLAKYEANI